MSLTEEDLQNILHQHSQEICGLYMGDYYEATTVIVEPEIKQLVDGYIERNNLLQKWSILREKMQGMRDAMLMFNKKESADDYEFVLGWMDLLDKE